MPDNKLQLFLALSRLQ